VLVKAPTTVLLLLLLLPSHRLVALELVLLELLVPLLLPAVEF